MSVLTRCRPPQALKLGLWSREISLRQRIVRRPIKAGSDQAGCRTQEGRAAPQVVDMNILGTQSAFWPLIVIVPERHAHGTGHVPRRRICCPFADASAHQLALHFCMRVSVPHGVASEMNDRV